nr:unnamed protein product [Callosobruchus chinensis]
MQTNDSPEVKVTTWAVAAFIAAICEPTFCFLVSKVTCFHFLADMSVPSSGMIALPSSSISDSLIFVRVAEMVDRRARCGSFITERILDRLQKGCDFDNFQDEGNYHTKGRSPVLYVDLFLAASDYKDLHKTVSGCELQSFADDTQLIHYFDRSDFEQAQASINNDIQMQDSDHPTRALNGYQDDVSQLPGTRLAATAQKLSLERLNAFPNRYNCDYDRNAISQSDEPPSIIYCVTDKNPSKHVHKQRILVVWRPPLTIIQSREDRGRGRAIKYIKNSVDSSTKEREPRKPYFVVPTRTIHPCFDKCYFSEVLPNVHKVNNHSYISFGINKSKLEGAKKRQCKNLKSLSTRVDRDECTYFVERSISKMFELAVYKLQCLSCGCVYSDEHFLDIVTMF